MNNLIDNLKTTYEAYVSATQALDTVVEEEIRNRNTIDELQELVDKLPSCYTNRRRIYEKINRLIG